MATPTIGTYTDDLLKRELVTPRTKSVRGAEIETSNLLGQIALSLYLNPRAVLYFPILARNSLVSAIGNELTKIDEVRRAVLDLNNQAFAIRDSGKLSNAISSLLKASQTGLASEVQVGTITRSIDSFLQGDVKKNVVAGSLGGIKRPSSEASSDLSALLGKLKALHEVTLTKLYALAVSVRNFSSVNFSMIQGPTILDRIKDGIESIVQEASADASGAGSVGMVNRLIAYKAALSTLTSPPSVNDPLLDSAEGIPKGYLFTAMSDQEQAVVLSTQLSSFTLPTGATLTVQDRAGTLIQANVPVKTYDLNGQAHIIGSFPESGEYPLSGTILLTVRTPLTTTGFSQTIGTYATWWTHSSLGDFWGKGDSWYSKSFKVSLAGVANNAALMTAIETSVGSSLIKVLEYPLPEYGKFIIVAKKSAYLTHNIDYVGVSQAAILFQLPGVLTEQAIQCTFTGGTTSWFDVLEGQLGPVPVTEMAEALTALFSGKLTAAPVTSGALKITGTDLEAGSFLTISGTAATPLGIGGTTLATSNKVSLVGSMSGSSRSVLNPTTLVGVHDLITVPTGTASVVAVSNVDVTLDQTLPTFSGDITATSKLHEVYSSLENLLAKALDRWLSSGFEVDLAKVDAAVASATGDRSLAASGSASSVLMSLSAALGDVLIALTDESTVLPAGAAKREVRLATSILNTLSERKMDAAEDMLLSGKIQEALLSDPQSLSYGSALAKAISDLAQNDVEFPNLATSDGISPKGIRRS